MTPLCIIGERVLVAVTRDITGDAGIPGGCLASSIYPKDGVIFKERSRPMVITEVLSPNFKPSSPYAFIFLIDCEFKVLNSLGKSDVRKDA